MSRIDGMPTEFEWKNFPEITTLGLLEKIQSQMRDLTVWTWALQWQDHLHVNVQRHCMTRKRKQRKMWNRKFPRGRWSFLGPGSEEKWYGTHTDKPDGSHDQTAQKMRQISQDPVIQYFVPPVLLREGAEAIHPIFRTTSAIEIGELRSKGKWNKSIHFNGSHENIELLLRTVISAN